MKFLLLPILVSSVSALVAPRSKYFRLSPPGGSQLSDDPGDGAKVQGFEGRMAAAESARQAAELEVQRKLSELESQLLEVEARHQENMAAEKKARDPVLNGSGDAKAPVETEVNGAGAEKPASERSVPPDYEKEVASGTPTSTVGPGQLHPKFVSRANNAAVKARWGKEELERMEALESATSLAAPISGEQVERVPSIVSQQGAVVFPAGKPKPDYAKVVTVGDFPTVAPSGQEHPRYRSRVNAETFKTRGGPEEQAAMGELAFVEPAKLAASTPSTSESGAPKVPSIVAQQGEVVFPAGKPQPDYEKEVTVGDRPLVVAPGQEHPRYRSRAQTETFKSRWGGEEVDRMEGGTSYSTETPQGGPEMPQGPPGAAESEAVPMVPSIVSQLGPVVFPEGKPKPNYEKQVVTGELTEVAAPGDEHPRYRSRAETETFKSRWGAEELGRMNAKEDAAPNDVDGSSFMQTYMVQAHETKLKLQRDAKELAQRVEQAEAKAKAGEAFMTKYMVDSLETRSALMQQLRLAEQKVEELETTLRIHQKAMEDTLVKGHLNKMEAVEKAKVDALAAYSDRLSEIQNALAKKRGGSK